jgi:hypothetical protein
VIAINPSHAHGPSTWGDRWCDLFQPPVEELQLNLVVHQRIIKLWWEIGKCACLYQRSKKNASTYRRVETPIAIIRVSDCGWESAGKVSSATKDPLVSVDGTLPASNHDDLVIEMDGRLGVLDVYAERLAETSDPRSVEVNAVRDFVTNRSAGRLDRVLRLDSRTV